MQDTSYWVSTPHWTCRVEVKEGKIHPSSARYLKTSYGADWDTWRWRMQKKYLLALHIVALNGRVDTSLDKQPCLF